jgi:hypothetical protein
MLRSWLGSLDGEILVFVAPEEVSSDAKDVLPALKLLTRNRAIKIEIARYICFYPLLVTMEGATIIPAIPLGIERDAFRVLAADVKLAFGRTNSPPHK